MDSSLPVDEQDDLSRLRIHIHHHLLDQSSHDAFFQKHVGLRRIPHRLQLRGQTLQFLPRRCGPLTVILDMLLDTQFDFANALQGLVSAALQFVGHKTIFRIRRIVLLLGPLRRITRRFQLSSQGL